MKISLGLMLMLATCITLGVASKLRINACKPRNRNVMMRRLAFLKVKMFPTPEVNTAHCGLEWTNHGTCCETESLKTYVESDSGNIDQFSVRFHREILMMRNHLEVLHTSLRIVQFNATAGLYFAPIYKKAEFIKTISNYLIGLEKAMKDIDTVEPLFIKSQTTCANEMNDLRSKAVCGVCSGRHRIFFKQRRAIIDEATCSQYVDNCIGSWKMLKKIIQIVQNSVYISSNIAAHKIFILNPYRGPIIRRMISWFSNIGLGVKVSRCKEVEPGTYACSKKFERSLCESTLSLVRPTYLQNTYRFLKNGVGDAAFKVVRFRAILGANKALEARIKSPKLKMLYEELNLWFQHSLDLMIEVKKDLTQLKKDYRSISSDYEEENSNNKYSIETKRLALKVKEKNQKAKSERKKAKSKHISCRCGSSKTANDCRQCRADQFSFAE